MIRNIICKHIVLSVPDFSSLKSGLEIVWLIILCILVIAASYFVTRYVGGTQQRKRRNSNFKLLDVCPLSNHKYLQIVKAGGRFFLISVCKDTVSFISELNEDELEFKDIPIDTYHFNEVFLKHLKKKKNNGINTGENSIKDNSKG